MNSNQQLDPKGEAGSKKIPLHLLPPYAMEQIAQAHKLGAEKYGPYNWRNGEVCATTYVAAMMRHLNAWRDGETLDPESGISHLAHVACNCNILLDAGYCNTLQDDRFKVKRKDLYTSLRGANIYLSATCNSHVAETIKAEEPIPLPEGLPPLPELPEGYDRWEYRGTRWKAPKDKLVSFCDNEEGWRSPSTGGTYGLPKFHYIEAVRTHKPHAELEFCGVCDSRSEWHHTLGWVCPHCDL